MTVTDVISSSLQLSYTLRSLCCLDDECLSCFEACATAIYPSITLYALTPSGTFPERVTTEAASQTFPNPALLNIEALACHLSNILVHLLIYITGGLLTPFPSIVSIHSVQNHPYLFSSHVQIISTSYVAINTSYYGQKMSITSKHITDH